MFKHEKERDDFLQNVISGPQSRPEFLLHAIHSFETPAFQPLDLSDWPVGTEISIHSMYDNGDPAIIELLSIGTPTLPDNLETVLSTALFDLNLQGAILSWYVFEFLFDSDVATLYGLWGKSVYGLCIHGEQPRLALSSDEREKESWKLSLQEALQYLYKQCPNLKR